MHAAYQIHDTNVDFGMKQWFRFIFSRAFVRTVLRLGLVWVILLGAVWMYLKVYTQPGATRTMPALKGLTLIEAQLSLEAEGLIPIHLDSIYSRKGRAFEVIEQVPPADSQIKTGRRVYLTTYRSTPPFESLDITEGQDMGLPRYYWSTRDLKWRKSSSRTSHWWDV